MHNLADLTVWTDDLPPPGTPEAELNEWFDENRYAPGPKVWEAEGDLRRLPGAAGSYVREEDRSWWLTRSRTVRDLCFTQKYVYYKLDDNGALSRAIMNARSQC
jgi:hypothetical protein